MPSPVQSAIDALIEQGKKVLSEMMVSGFYSCTIFDEDRLDPYLIDGAYLNLTSAATNFDYLLDVSVKSGSGRQAVYLGRIQRRSETEQPHNGHFYPVQLVWSDFEDRILVKPGWPSDV